MNTLLEMLYHEHDEILKFTAKLKKISLKFMTENYFNIDEYKDAIHFIREYADKRHHQKEEEILFNKMIEVIGLKAENLIRYGMLVEHDLARFQVNELEKAVDKYEQNKTDENKLDVISLSMGYCYLLERHAEKENKVVYPLGERSLRKETMQELDKKAIEYEKKYL